MILVGEMRDLETISTALTAAETGHLVLATLHTQDAPQTIDRIIDVFPPDQQQQVRVMLSVALQGVVAQQLLPTADGSGRVPAVEILIPTPAVRNLIREGKTHQIYSAIQTGAEHGMQTMDSALAELVRAGPDHPRRRPAPRLGPGRAGASAGRRSRPPGRRRKRLPAMSVSYVFRAVDTLGVKRQGRGRVRLARRRHASCSRAAACSPSRSRPRPSRWNCRSIDDSRSSWRIWR